MLGLAMLSLSQVINFLTKANNSAQEQNKIIIKNNQEYCFRYNVVLKVYFMDLSCLILNPSIHATINCFVML